MLNLTGLG